MSKKPTKFKDLKVGELYRSASDDFALPVEETDSKDVLLAAFAEGGVEWGDYVTQHPEVAPDEDEYVPAPANVVGAVEEKQPVVAVEAPVVRVDEGFQAKPNDQFLLKMTRKNALFETCGYRFTQEHPYALVDPGTAQYILEREDGFRQAFPNEVQEFYG